MLAFALVLENGLARANIERVARRSSVGKAAIYRHALSQPRQLGIADSALSAGKDVQATTGSRD